MPEMEQIAGEIAGCDYPEADRSLINTQVKKLQGMIGKKGKYRPIELTRELQKAMWDKVGPAREERKLKKGLIFFLQSIE